MKKYIALPFRVCEGGKIAQLRLTFKKPHARGFCFDMRNLVRKPATLSLKNTSTIIARLCLYVHIFTTRVGLGFFRQKLIKSSKHDSGLSEKSEWPKQKRQ